MDELELGLNLVEPLAIISCDRCGNPVQENDIWTNDQDETICQNCAEKESQNQGDQE